MSHTKKEKFIVDLNKVEKSDSDVFAHKRPGRMGTYLDQLKAVCCSTNIKSKMKPISARSIHEW